jgi:hypothetical protein
MILEPPCYRPAFNHHLITVAGSGSINEPAAFAGRANRKRPAAYRQAIPAVYTHLSLKSVCRSAQQRPQRF